MKKKKHADAKEDKSLIRKMMAKPQAKVASHLVKDIKEQTHGIKEDVGLMKSLKKK